MKIERCWWISVVSRNLFGITGLEKFLGSNLAGLSKKLVFALSENVAFESPGYVCWIPVTPSRRNVIRSVSSDNGFGGVLCLGI